MLENEANSFESMDFDKSAMCEKIINEMDVIFHKDPDLVGFEIIPMTPHQNKSPVQHVRNNLGLESWCIEHVYAFAHKFVIGYKLSNSKFFFNENMMKYLNCVILINPDVLSFWNLRRQLVEKNRLVISKEFHFTSIILSKKPKSNEAFAYRRWLFSFQSEEAIDWAFELSLCIRCAERSICNYHAWTHRQWVLQKAPHLFQFEYYKISRYMQRFVTDYCGFNHRQHVLEKLLEQCFTESDAEFGDIKMCIEQLIGRKPNDKNELVAILLPNVNVTKAHAIKLSSFLFCMDLAISDIKRCDDFRSMYGDRLTFEYHQRAIVRYVVQHCVTYNNDNAFVNTYKPVVVDLPKSTDEYCEFLRALIEREIGRGEKQKQWCQIFLGIQRN